MQKRICLFFIAVCLLLGGCTHRDTAPQPEATATPAAVPAPTEASVEDGTSTGVAQPTAEPVPGSILDGKQLVENNTALYLLPNTMVESAVQQEVALYEDGLLLYGPVAVASGPGYRLALLSLADGSVLRETTLTGLELPEVRVRSGWNLDVSDYSDGELRMFSDDFAVFTYVSDHAPCGVYCSADGMKYYSVAQNGIYVLDAATNAMETVLDNVTGLYPGERSGDYVSLSYTDLNTQLDRQAVLNLAAGTVEHLPFEGVFDTVEQSDGLWLAGREDGWYLGRGNRPSTFTVEEPYSNATLLADPARILVSSWDRQAVETMTLYSPEGRFISQCRLPSACGRFGEPVWSEQHGGYFFTIVEPVTGSDRLLFWDLSVPMSGEDLTMKPAYGQTAVGTAVSPALYARAAELGSTYGVTVQIAEQVEGEYNFYTVAQELDETGLSAGLDALERALSAYPTGFMPQLHHGSYQSIEFRLAGAITKKNLPETVSGFSSFSAFVETQPGEMVVVLDVNNPGSLEQTLYHEIAHLVDNKLTFDAALRPESAYTEANWAALNPAGFAYAETYDAIPMHYFTDGYDAYFMDIYSRTFAREDRARILEYAMIGADYAFSTPERRGKLAYLGSCIRDCFAVSGWPTETMWETTLSRNS